MNSKAQDLIKERPILFKAEMVNAILAGRKTQTRRVMKVQPQQCHLVSRDACSPSGYSLIADAYDDEYLICPQGKRSDRLWVRETWQTGMTEEGPMIAYRAENACYPIDAWDGEDYGTGASFNYEKCPKATWHTWLGDLLSGSEGDWRPSIYMPRWASRTLLEITDIRVERLNDISEDGAIAEGCVAEHLHGGMWATAYSQFYSLWESINGKDSWDKNPWVWVIEFKSIPL